MTPPMGRASLHGELLRLESLMDEYFDTLLLQAERVNIIKEQIISLLKAISWPGLDKILSKKLY